MTDGQSFKKLRRSTDDRVFAGVCGGIARYFDLDPVLIRIGFVVAALGFGTGFLLYLVCIFVMPNDDSGR